VNGTILAEKAQSGTIVTMNPNVGKMEGYAALIELAVIRQG